MAPSVGQFGTARLDDAHDAVTFVALGGSGHALKIAHALAEMLIWAFGVSRMRRTLKPSRRWRRRRWVRSISLYGVLVQWMMYQTWLAFTLRLLTSRVLGPWGVGVLPPSFLHVPGRGRGMHRNLETVKNYFANCVDGKAVDRVGEYFADDVIVHRPDVAEPIVGVEKFKHALRSNVTDR